MLLGLSTVSVYVGWIVASAVFFALFLFIVMIVKRSSCLLPKRERHITSIPKIIAKEILNHIAIKSIGSFIGFI